MIYIVPQLPIRDRYQSWLVEELRKSFDKYEVDYVVVDLNKEPVIELTNYFTNEYEAIDYELSQIKFLNRKVTFGDKVLWLDLDYPGFSVATSFLFKARGVANYGILHGAYFNEGDVWCSLPCRRHFMKSAIEVADKVFVGSNYFKQELVKHLVVNDDKIVVTGLPFRYGYYKQHRSKAKKDNLVVFVGELPEDVLSALRKRFELVRLRNLPYEKYLDLLSSARAYVVWKRSETYGYSVLESLALGTPVVAPNRFSYPEFKSKLSKGRSITLVDEVGDVISAVEEVVSLEASDVIEDSDQLLRYMSASSDRIVRLVANV